MSTSRYLPGSLGRGRGSRVPSRRRTAQRAATGEQRELLLEGNRIGGLIVLAAGGGLTVALHQIVRDLPVYLVGTIPMSVGIVLLLTPLLVRRRAR